MDLRHIGHTLPPGFRFYPSDEELVCHYLHKKIVKEQVDLTTTLIELDLHTCEPWQLPDVAKLNSKEWYFFSFRDRKYATGFRTNRATRSGYWKATGKDRPVIDSRSQTVVGMRKTLVFYKNRAPNGIKTGWIMHEFRLDNPNLPPKEEWVLCRVFYKSIRGESDHNKWINPSYGDSTTHLQNINNTSDDQQHVSNIYAASFCDHLEQNPSCSKALVALPVDPLEGFFHGIDDQMSGCDQMVETKCEDEYGFLLELDYGIGGGDEYSNSMVFM